jgi:hypothetical protein
MAGPSKSMRLDDDEICEELWKDDSILIQIVNLVMTYHEILTALMTKIMLMLAMTCSMGHGQR